MANLQAALGSAFRAQAAKSLGKVDERIRRDLVSQSVSRELVQALESLGRKPYPIFKSRAFIDLLSAAKALAGSNASDKEQKVEALRAALRVMEPLAAAELESASRASSIKLGLFGRSDETYGFCSLVYSPGEGALYPMQMDGARVAPFLAASALVALDAPRGTTGRVGGGLVLGDPEREVFGLGVSFNRSPNLVDCEIGWTLRLGQIRDTETARLLLDHVRAGDTWLTAGARWISNSRSFVGGQMVETSLTYAIPGRGHRLGAILTISGIYSAQKALRVDEGGAEIRVPLSDPEATAEPIYLSVRYGTRGHGTLSLERRF